MSKASSLLPVVYSCKVVEILLFLFEEELMHRSGNWTVSLGTRFRRQVLKTMTMTLIIISLFYL